MKTLTSENLKRILTFETFMITLDEDGIFDQWIEDKTGDLLYNNVRYSLAFAYLRPSELFRMLGRNVKRVA